jgi:hypothetical protein
MKLQIVFLIYFFSKLPELVVMYNVKYLGDETKNKVINCKIIVYFPVH